MEFIEKDRLLNIANKLAWNYYKTNSSFTFDEIQSAAYFGLAKGLQSYRENQGKKITSWVYSIVNWEILKAFENEKKHKDVLPFDYEDEDNYSLEERIGSEEFEESILNGMLIEKALTALTANEIKLIYLKFYNQLSYSDISKLINVPKTSVSNRITRALEKMKNKLNEREYITISILPDKVRNREVEAINTYRDYIVSRVKAEAHYIIENQCTLRDAAEKFKLGKTTIHKDVVQRLPRIDKNLFIKVCRVLDHNLDDRTTRGGESTRRKYMRGCEAIGCIKEKSH